MLHIGYHESSSGGYAAMGKEAVSVQADTFAFFTRNPRGGQAKEIDADDVAEFRAFAAEHSFAPLVAHAPYTMNPCSADPGLREFAKNLMIDDLHRMSFTPGNLYNFHPGSHVQQGADVGIDFTSTMLSEVIAQCKKDGILPGTVILIETMAGKGSEIGRSVEELAQIYDGVSCNDKLRVCFDTCHTSDAGYDIIHNFDGVMEKFDKLIGKDQIAVFHMNDSKNEPGAAKDRHENFGFGKIGFDALMYIMNHPDFEEVPKILESPYIKDPENSKKSYEPFAREIAMIRSGVFDPEMIEHVLQDNK